MAFPLNPMAKKVLLVEGNNERDLCSLLINKKLGLNVENKNVSKFIEDDNIIQIITINEVDNKNNITSFIKTSNYNNIEKLNKIIVGESSVRHQLRRNIFK